jgi:soluble lytic murein transglycosylase-like protein
MRKTAARTGLGSVARTGLLGLGALALAALATGCSSDVSRMMVQATPRTAASFSQHEQAEREAILSLVREHRRNVADRRHQELVEAVYVPAREAGMDPLLVAAIVASESSFRSRSVSPHGAVGLMQLRPFVARDLAARSDVEWRGAETLHSPDVNVRLGIRYYQELLDDFGGDHHVALTAYNFGPTRVKEQIRSGEFTRSAYARRIMSLYGDLCSRRDAVEVPRRS